MQKASSSLENKFSRCGFFFLLIFFAKQKMGLLTFLRVALSPKNLPAAAGEPHRRPGANELVKVHNNRAVFSFFDGHVTSEKMENTDCWQSCDFRHPFVTWQ